MHAIPPVRAFRPRTRPTAVAAAAALLLAGPGLALAQSAPAPAAAASAPAAAEPLRVQVTGIRQALETSLTLKRDSRGVVDGIVAEDMGKFPDTNLAEAMQRISGVSIDRSLGEGSRVTIRGVGPDFNLVLLNGRQMPVAGIEATAASNSRSFDFANLAAESIAALEVYKTGRASTPVGGLGGTINVKTARPFDHKGPALTLGVKGVVDTSNSRLPEQLKGDSVTPEISGLYSTTFADGTMGVAISASHQVRHLGYNDASVPGGWRAFRGDEVNWGTIPLPGAPGSENITNRPGPDEVYSVPQNLLYSLNGIQRERTNGQLTFQYRPRNDLTATLDYTYSENKLATRRNELSAWFNFGPSVSTWTDGPVAAPLVYSEVIAPPGADVAMGGSRYATRSKNDSIGINLAWKPSKAFSLELDAHSSKSTSGADSPYGSNAVIGTAQFNRLTTTADFRQPFPVLSIQGTPLDASLMQVTGSSFRNSYMEQEIDQVQLHGKLQLESGVTLNFGAGTSDVSTRTAYGFVQQDTWGGATNPGDYPDSLWQPTRLNQYFNAIPGSSNGALYNQFFLWDFDAVRDIAARVGNPANYSPPASFSVDRRTREQSQSLYVQAETFWDVGSIPMGLAAGLRYESTKVTSSALVPAATGVDWVGNNEYAVRFGAPTFTTLVGKYDHVLPSIDFDADLRPDLKFRASYGESIGRPSWEAIQGGQTLDQLARFDGGTGSQGNPALKPLKSKNIDLSLEFYYAKGSYAALGFFEKRIANYVGNEIVRESPFGLRTPAEGVWYNEAITAGGCTAGDSACIRTYIFDTYDGRFGVDRAAGIIPGQPGDPVMSFRISRPANKDSASLRGVELNLQHLFAGTGFGASFNYTHVTSNLKYNNAGFGQQFALVGLSDTANVVAFYEAANWQVRVAYNWRDGFLASVFDGAGPNPVYFEPYKQVDVSASVDVNKQLTLSIEGINLTDAYQRAYGRNERQLVGVSQTGPRYMIGARYKF